MSPTRYHYATLLGLLKNIQPSLYISQRNYQQTYFIMHILLPDFAFPTEHQPTTALKSHLKKLTFNRARTVEARRSESLNHTTFHQMQKSLYLKHRTVRQPSMPATERIMDTHRSQLLQSTLYDNPKKFNSGDGQPIHSRKASKFVNTLLPKRRSFSKNTYERPKKIVDPTFNFLKTTKYSYHFPQVFDPEIAAQVIKRKKSEAKPRNFSSKFPTKKVKSAFHIQEYRPWSPKKGQITLDQFN